MCNSNAPTSMIEQGIVVQRRSGSFTSNGLEKKSTNHARSRNSSVALKHSVCEKEYLVRLAIPQDGRKKDLTRKTCKRPSSLEEDSFSSTGFVDRLASSGLCWFPLVSIYGWNCGTLLISIIRLPAIRARAGGRRHAEGCKYHVR